MTEQQGDRFQRGVTLMEALVVLGLIGVIMLIAIPVFINVLQSYRTQTAVSQMAINLRFARNAAVKQKIRYQVRVNRDGDLPSNRYFVEYEPFGSFTFVKHMQNDMEGGSYCNCIKMPQKIKILDTTTATTIIFDSRGGAAGSGDIFVEGVDGSQYRIRISPVGGVEKIKL